MFFLSKGGGNEAAAGEQYVHAEPGEPKKDAYEGAESIEWFDKHPHQAMAGAVEILKKLNELEPGALPKGLVRNEKVALQRISERGLGWESDFYVEDQRQLLSWRPSKTSSTGYLVLLGRREDQTKFRSYFVRVGGKMSFDWEASTGWSKIPIEKLATMENVRGVLVRCRLAKEAYFDFDSSRLQRNTSKPSDAGSPEAQSLYLLRGTDLDVPYWGSVPKGSDLDRRLKALFNFERIVLDEKREVQAIVRLDKPEGSRENQFKISELVCEEWVLPTNKSEE